MNFFFFGHPHTFALQPVKVPIHKFQIQYDIESGIYVLALYVTAP